MLNKITAILILVILATAGCQNSSEDVIKIGVIAPLTGDFGSYGQDIQRGISIALAEESMQGVKMVYEDACLPKEASASIQKLISIDQVDLVSGVFCIISVEPILALANPNDINVMMVASVPDSFVGISENLFSAHFAIKSEGIAQAEFAYNYLGARTAVVLYLDNAFGASYEANFANRFEELGGEIILKDKLDVYKGDFRTPLTKVKVEEPDVVLAVHLGTELGLILKQAEELQINADFLGTYEAEDASVLAAAGNAAEGFWISSSNIAETNEVRNFKSEFIAKYGESPSAVAQNAYDGIKLQVSAYKACSGDKECIRNTIRETKDYSGASGTFSISEDGTAKKEIVFKQVQNREFKLV